MESLWSSPHHMLTDFYMRIWRLGILPLRCCWTFTSRWFRTHYCRIRLNWPIYYVHWQAFNCQHVMCVCVC